MKIADLQSFLRSLAPVLSSSGGAKVATDLDRMAQGLTPFQSLTIAEFADFLAKADEYVRTGIVPTKPGKAKAPARSSADLVQEALRLARSLYDTALDANFRFEAVDVAMAGLKKLKVDDLKKVAKELDIFSVPKKKDDIIAEIGRKIKGRREFHDRTRMDGPGSVVTALDEWPNR
jgi:hypothetical protein